MIQRFAVLACLFTGGIHAAQLPTLFEPAGSDYVASSHGQLIEVSTRGVRVAAAGAASRTILEWQGATVGALVGKDPTGGVSHYFAGSNQVLWRTAVPQYSRVQARDLYGNMDVSYYFREGHLEFDINARPGSDPGAWRFAIPGAARLEVDAAGDLTVDSGGRLYRWRSPRAYQARDGAREPVQCRYELDRKREIAFHVGAYDRSRELVIDPVVEFLTYLGGSGIDEINAVATDPNGNVVVAGITNSVNFPGGGTATGAISIFVTKLNPSGSAVLFTTLLGSRPNADAEFPLEDVNSLAVDSDGSIYILGTTVAQNFPTTSGAWQQNSGGAFITRLNSGGQVVYSTFLGPSSWGLRASRVRARNGYAYLAGTVGAAEFLGTSGALQRNVSGSQDFFAIKMAADGSGPLFATAFGGSGTEALSDMALDASGNILLVGTSTSADLPVTPDALPYRAPGGSSSGAFLARIDSTGSRLISSTWLGTAQVGSIASVPDGGLVVAGAGTLPASLTSLAPLHSLDFTGRGAQAYLAKLPATSNRPLWTTALLGAESFLWGISADAQGNLYWPGYPYTVSGGGLGFSTGSGVSKLSADGSLLLYASAIRSASLVAAVATAGPVCFAGYTSFSGLPVTSGVVQPSRDPAPSGTWLDQLNYYDGFVGVLDLSSFTTGNFFATPPDFALAVTWRIGEPAPADSVQPIQWSGAATGLSVTPSARLTASYSASGSPAVNINANTSQSVAGTFQESVTLQSQANPNASLAMPVSLTVKPQVSFDLASSQVTIRYRQGQTRTPATVAITTHFGNEYFTFNVTSSATWMYGYVNQVGGQQVLSVTTRDQQPGTYSGALTVSLQGLQNANRVLQVQYIVDPPATIQLSATSISLHLVKGQPVTPVVVKVTSSVPGVQWSVFVGMAPAWLQVSETTTATPGEIHITGDPVAAQPGYGIYNMFVSGENDQQIVVSMALDVSSGAPLDVVPNSITTQFVRGTASNPNVPALQVTAPTTTTVQHRADQSWVIPQTGYFATPGYIGLSFDTTLPEGVYKANVTFSAGANSVVVPVSYSLYDAPHLVFPATPISFQWRIGDPLPATQQIHFTCPTLTPDFVNAGPTDYPSFLQVTPSYGSTPLTITLTADPTGLGAGTYKTQLSVQGTYPDSTSYTPIPVTLTILPNPNAPTATVTRVADAASYLGGAVSPGEAVVLFGSGLGPTALVQSQVNTIGRFPTSLAGWTVSFDGMPAPVLYVSDKQSAAMVPFGAAGKTTTSVTVSTGGTPSVPVSVPVAATNPSVFTADASGSGLAAAVNVAADGSISPNAAAAPAPKGGVVTFYATGLGATTPSMPDGSLAGVPLPQLNAAVRVLVGGQTADLLYAGPAPGQVAGLMQLNIRIPAGAPSGLASLLVVAGDNVSQPGVTLAVQ
jgi:uncharacterized protein (TIGR03437 family)